MKPEITIIGYGRFGKLWAEFLAQDFKVFVVSQRTLDIENPNIQQIDLEAGCQKDVIIPIVPISKFESVFQKIAPHLKPHSLCIDVCSVKVHPANVMTKYAPDNVELIATHPMFGPDSTKNGFGGLNMAFCPLRASRENEIFWREYFTNKGINILEMTPEEHDKYAANSQAIAHLTGRFFEEMKLKNTPIDTPAFKTLMQLTDLTCNDTWELFHDLQLYNDYTKATRKNILTGINNVYKKLMSEPRRDNCIIGIQGGPGSFNEVACNNITTAKALKSFDLKYLYTSNKVLEELFEGEIDYGVFALQNSVGGIVLETVEAMSQYNCEIIDIFQIAIKHHLFVYNGTDFKNIKTIISHPQALKQCKDHLKELQKEFDFTIEPGEGLLIDQATAAKHLHLEKLPKTTAVLASEACNNLYENISIIKRDLQDDSTNITDFVFCKRR